MANEIQFPTSPPVTSATVYAIVRNASGQVWDTITLAFVTFVDANISRYVIACNQEGTASGYYTASFPTTITTAGKYPVTAFKQIGGSPSVADTLLAEGVIEWNGSSEVTAAGSYLITLQYAKDSLGITDSSKDSLLSNVLIPAVSNEVEKWLNRKILPSDYSEFYDPTEPNEKLVLRNYPITALTKVTIRPYFQDATAIDGSNFIISNQGVIAFKPTYAFWRYFPRGFQSVKVEYSAGYTTVPADIQQATAKLLQNYYFAVGRDTSMLSEKIGDYQYTQRAQWANAWTDEIRYLLAPYRSRIIV